MESVCRRCYHFSKNLYRVTTEDGGVVLLNYVCMPFMCAAREEFGACHRENGIGENSR
jgi:hypothetical protein